MSTKFSSVCLFVSLFLVSGVAYGERIQNLVDVQGVRTNQLIGYGLVVGLDGTGDQTTQTPFTTQAITNMLKRFGIIQQSGNTTMQLKNVAAVMVTAKLPPFAQPGEHIPVVVSSMGNAKSLRGGMLLMTQLHGSDGRVYAIAQGSLVVGGYGASAGGNKTQTGSLTVGRIPNGASVELAIADSNFDTEPTLTLDLKDPNFSTAERIKRLINVTWGNGTAVAENSGAVIVKMPDSANSRVAFMSELLALDVKPGRAPARIIIDQRSGTVVLGADVRIGPCAVAHGDLTVTVTRKPLVSQPGAFSRGRTVSTAQTNVKAKEKKAHILLFNAGASLGAVVRALNAVGATPTDLVSILQAMKQAGAINGQLEVE